MRRTLLALALLLGGAGLVRAHGLLIPEEKTLPPLAMLNHKVSVKVEDQVAVTRVEQTFRNHTSRQLEATYVFPVPKGASVNKFTMWVNGKETKGELVEAKQAREIYASIVRRTEPPSDPSTGSSLTSSRDSWTRTLMRSSVSNACSMMQRRLCSGRGAMHCGFRTPRRRWTPRPRRSNRRPPAS